MSAEQNKQSERKTLFKERDKRNRFTDSGNAKNLKLYKYK